MISIRSLGLMVAFVSATAVPFVAPCHAQSPSGTTFNHFLTGFPLTGEHSTVDCAACHVSGRFSGTPRQCANCHNSASAVGKSQTHPQTTNFCEGCHLTTSWRDLRYIDHVQATGPCVSCHNGTAAIGKPANHIVTSAPCGNCHQSTVT